MSTSYRIRTNLQNNSFTVGPDSPAGMGATVIPASRGPMAPVRINRGETARLRMLFGANRYEVLEAIAYNNRYPLWISAPHSGGAFAALLLTDAGLKPCPISFSGDPDTIDFSNLWLQFKAGVSDGVTEAWAISFDGGLLPASGYTPEAALVIGDEVFNAVLTWNASASRFDVSVPGRGAGTATPAGSEIIVDFAFQTGQVPARGIPISFRCATDANKLDFPVHAIVGMKFPCDDFMAAAVYKSETEGHLVLDLRHKKRGAYSQLGGYPVEIALAEGTVNGSGLLIYAPELLRSDDFIFVLPNKEAPLDWDVWTGGSGRLSEFKGGFRGAECAGQLLVEGWDQFKEFKKHPADIYFDTTADPLVPAKFSALRAEIPYRRFLYPLPMGMKAGEVTRSNPSKPDNRGLGAFWGAAFVMNLFEPTGNLLSTLMGEVASRYADARVFSFGGRAVAWGDENQVGGQLNQGRIVKFLYDAREDEMQQLDRLRVNPIVMNELFGPMVASRRTTDTSETDYSFSDYSMIVDYCVERIVNEVLPYQLIKFNDDSHRAIVRAKTELILKPLTQMPNNVIRDFAVKCDGENNGDDVLARREFVLTVAIKVTPKSEFIVFNFINSAQGGSVESDVR